MTSQTTKYSLFQRTVCFIDTLTIELIVIVDVTVQLHVCTSDLCVICVSQCVHGHIILTSSSLDDLFACLRSVSRAGSHKAFGYGLLNLRGAY